MSRDNFRFEIGTQYYPARKHTYLVTITDRLTTRNDNGEIVSTCYVGTHEFCGQIVTDHNISDTEIARGLLNVNHDLPLITKLDALKAKYNAAFQKANETRAAALAAHDAEVTAFNEYRDAQDGNP